LPCEREHGMARLGVGVRDRLRRHLVELLGPRIRGEVLTDQRTLSRHSRDQSMYCEEPLVVVRAEDVGDVVEVLEQGRQEGVPITARGAGSGTAGAGIGCGILLVLSDDGELGQILADALGADGPTVRVGAAVLHDRLQRHLRDGGYFLPADPSSGAMSLIGGNVATKASGPHALKHGSIDRYMVSARVVLADGTHVDTARPETLPRCVRDGLEALRRSVLADDESRDRLVARDGRKIASGYNLFGLLRRECPAQVLTQLLAGSVGTLGVVTDVTLRAEPVQEGTTTTLVRLERLSDVGQAVQHLRCLDVAAIELINRRSVAMVNAKRPKLALPGGDAHTLLIECTGEGRLDTVRQVEALVEGNDYSLASPVVTVASPEEQARLWRARKALMPVVRRWAPDQVAPSLVNDVGVPPEHLASFLSDIERLFEDLGIVAAIYGHAGSGNLHLRPLVDPNRRDLAGWLKRIADAVYEIVLSYDGTITAEHGMGRLRVPYLEREWGVALVEHMRTVKSLLDPSDMLNPGTMFSERPFTEGICL